jgi:[ribosomal protein S18]-alanine N-acetyltransferase
VADADSEIAGFCISARQGARGYIVTIDVLPQFRRLHVGTALLEEIERRLAKNGVREVALETATDNDSAVAFWRKYGYRSRGIREGYYPNGRDAFSMVKLLG